VKRKKEKRNDQRGKGPTYAMDQPVLDLQSHDNHPDVGLGIFAYGTLWLIEQRW
jgi:hypothetical protein